MFVFSFALAAASLLMLSAGARAAEVITLTNSEWVPYTSQQLPHNGPLSRIVSEAFALEGVEVRYVFRPFGRAYAEAATGYAHGSILWSTSGRDSDRQRRFIFSDVVFDGQSVLFHLKSYPFRWQGYAQLAGVRMGGTAGYEYAFDKYPYISMDRTAVTDEANFRKLAAGRLDVFPANLDVGRAIMRNVLTPEQAELVTWDPNPYNITHYHLMLNKLNKDNPRYLALFNKGLRRLRDSGKYDEYLQVLK
ncbi:MULTISPECIES: ABC transporter substrate-binding protein [unclassified Duganella]|uniref:substrate-binding periplasmic protein n=1 Tax=unclassified Duganella TaxID=2636909 RepID=UPI00088F78A7|nr:MULTISPECIES: transporter substrate-binding domain-containing protein [unclassified Duganella]SDG40288.1 amino acid ABC transporter substrate-binding protein, PAAT family [Duganella sp. OV458]SDJ63618.1 amino acid ABC transporter substrate-binding protein, PAAT family [Duganella sp. OV510]